MVLGCTGGAGGYLGHRGYLGNCGVLQVLGYWGPKKCEVLHCTAGDWVVLGCTGGYWLVLRVLGVQWGTRGCFGELVGTGAIGRYWGVHGGTGE